MDINFDVDTNTSPNENTSNIITPTTTPLTSTTTSTTNTSANKNVKTNNKDTSSNNKKFDTVLKYFVFGMIMVLVVCLTIFICYKTFKTQTNNLGTLLETSRKEEAILRGKLKSAEQEKILYAQKLNQLNTEFQRMQTNNPYNSTLPMTKTSYDAPDPDKTKEKRKLLSDKEAIKAYINSKRQTVQDEIDEREAEKREEQKNMKHKIKEEIQSQTNTKQNNEEYNDDDYEDKDKVDEIMSIIQPQ